MKRIVFFFVLFATFANPAYAQDIPVVVPKPNILNITDLGKLISSLFAAIIVIAGLISFFQLIIGGFQWIVSGGNKENLEAARNKIIHAIIGLIIVFSTWALMLLVQQFLGVTFLGPIRIPRAF